MERIATNWQITYKHVPDIGSLKLIECIDR